VAKKMEAAFASATAGTYKEDVKSKAVAKPQNLVKPTKSVSSKSSSTSFLKDAANKENTSSFNSLLSSSTSNMVVNAARVSAKEGEIQSNYIFLIKFYN
jgi:chromosomal replication initiation ATPase DnaA